MNQNLWNVAKSNAQKETYNFKFQYKKREKGFKQMIPAYALKNEGKKKKKRNEKQESKQNLCKQKKRNNKDKSEKSIREQTL